MNRAQFWKMIATIDQQALREGDEDGAVEPLVEALSELDEAEIKSFEDNLAEVLYDLDGKEFLASAGDSGQSFDAFLYARCFVVARGQKFYENVKAHPSRMPKSLEQWCEALLYVSPQAWSAASGQDPEDWDHVSPVSYESGSNTKLWQ